jgi:hypothetical protein
MKDRYHIRAVIMVAAAAAVLPPVALADKVYKWTDAQGNVSYQDHPPPVEAIHSETKEINPEDITTRFEPPARVPASAASPPSPPASAPAPAQAQIPTPLPITKRLDEEMLRKLLIGAGAGSGTGTGTGAVPGTSTGTGTGTGAASGAGDGSTPAPAAPLQQIPTP